MCIITLYYIIFVNCADMTPWLYSLSYVNNWQHVCMSVYIHPYVTMPIICPYVCASVCNFVEKSVRILNICASVCTFVEKTVRMIVRLYVPSSRKVSVCLCVCMYLRRGKCPYVCTSVCTFVEEVSVCLYVCMYLRRGSVRWTSNLPANRGAGRSTLLIVVIHTNKQTYWQLLSWRTVGASLNVDEQMNDGI